MLQADTFNAMYTKINSCGMMGIRGWMYCFQTTHYDTDNSECTEVTFKIGKTDKCLIERLQQYKDHSNRHTNIYAINCTVPEHRERLLKAYLRNVKSLKPVVGQEYYQIPQNTPLIHGLKWFSKIPESTILDLIKDYTMNDAVAMNKLIVWLKQSDADSSLTSNVIAKELNFVCKLCNKMCPTEQGLKIHYSKIHADTSDTSSKKPAKLTKIEKLEKKMRLHDARDEVKCLEEDVQKMSLVSTQETPTPAATLSPSSTTIEAELTAVIEQQKQIIEEQRLEIAEKTAAIRELQIKVAYSLEFSSHIASSLNNHRHSKHL